MMDAAKRASLGKAAESAVKRVLDNIAKNPEYPFFKAERVLDSRSRAVKGKKFRAGPARVGDFQAFYRGSVAFLEVKETEETRLPKGNFPRGQIARAKLQSLSGSLVVVIVHYKKLGEWHVVPIDYFFDNVVSSWDTSMFPKYRTASAAVLFALAPILK